MFGWINDCTECLVVSKFGEETWHKIKEKAGCQVSDGGFLRYKYYPDSDTVQLVVAASEVLGISIDDVLYAFGDYFIEYVQENGYSNVLECLGSNMRDWLSNLNSLHDHLQASYPEGFVAPIFWSEDDPNSPEGEEAILVYYFSHRGSLLVPLVVGLLKKLARVYFDIDIHLDQLTLQDEDNGVQHTSWKVTTVDPNEAYKLRHKRRKNRTGSSVKDDQTITTAETTTVNKYERTFREGGAQAAYLRVEEFVKRSFLNADCELYHALSLEMYVYLVNYWKTTKIDGKWCFEIWSIQDDNPKSWASIKDLPPLLNPSTIDPSHFGGKVPGTAAFPPGEQGVLQSFPPKVRVFNPVTGKSVELVVARNTETILDAIGSAPEVVQAKITEFEDPEVQARIDNNDLELQWVVWNEVTDDGYHTFAPGDLTMTTTQQLFDLVPNTFDPIKIVVKVTETIEVDDDEEDI